MTDSRIGGRGACSKCGKEVNNVAYHERRCEMTDKTSSCKLCEEKQEQINKLQQVVDQAKEYIMAQALFIKEHGLEKQFEGRNM